MLVDTHAHLTDPRFAGEIGEVLERAREAGVYVVVTVASNLADSEQTVALAGAHSGVYATIGIHPHEASSATPQSFERLRELVTHRVVAIGETGLDFHYDTSPRPIQREVFSRHLELARELNLPVVVHARDADEEVSEIIRSAGWQRGVLHCFSSGRPLLESALELGWYISFAGMITFTKWESADLLRSVPLDRLLVETDSPYLAPVPHRGKRNEPAFVRLVVERAALLRGESTETLIATTTANAFAFYGIEPSPSA
jgi:TatD DNase family protein